MSDPIVSGVKQEAATVKSDVLSAVRKAGTTVSSTVNSAESSVKSAEQSVVKFVDTHARMFAYAALGLAVVVGLFVLYQAAII